jgi:hypothetical protein
VYPWCAIFLACDSFTLVRGCVRDCAQECDGSKWEWRQEEGGRSEGKGREKGRRGNEGNTQSSACTHGVRVNTRAHTHPLINTHKSAHTNTHRFTRSHLHARARTHTHTSTLARTRTHKYCSSPQAGQTRSRARDQRKATQPAHHRVRMHQEPRHEHASRALASHVSAGPKYCINVLMRACVRGIHLSAGLSCSNIDVHGDTGGHMLEQQSIIIGSQSQISSLGLQRTWRYLCRADTRPHA